jgi:hypothetical protein
MSTSIEPSPGPLAQPKERWSGAKTAIVAATILGVTIGGGVVASSALGSDSASSTVAAAQGQQGMGQAPGAQGQSDGTAQGQTGTTQGQTGTAPGQAGAAQGQTGTAPGQAAGQAPPGGGGPGGTAGGGALHSESVVSDGNGGYTTVRTQTGEVTAVSDASITVKSDDGYSSTYAITADTQTSGDLATGTTVSVRATVSGDDATATQITATS